MSRPRPTLPSLALLFAATLWPSLAAAPLRAQTVEEILGYDVDIDVRPGGSMLVTETIRVRALGEQIRRGIYRDFPTSFPRWAGLGRIEAPFTVLSVRRDGRDENYAVEAIGGEFRRGGMRVRIGNRNVLLEPGEYTYEIVYETDRWVRFGDDEDQLYWNVTGSGWAFPIRSASARIHVPELSSPPRLESWTGPEGSTTSTATAEWDTYDRTASFRSDTPMGAHEGLTVRLTFPRGQLTPPTDAQTGQWFRLDWGGYIDAAYLVLLVVGVYLLMWRRVGIDPAPGPISFRREPPEGYSPAALGFIEKRGYDRSLLSSALVSMALKGAIRIDESDGEWTLHRTDGDPEGLSEEEEKLYRKLLGSRSSIRLQQSNHSTLSGAIKQFRASLTRQLQREYFVNNREWFFAGLAVTLVGFAVLAWRWRFDINPVALFLGLWLSIWTLGVATLGLQLWRQFRSALGGGGPGAWAGTGTLALFSIPFFGAELLVGGFLAVLMPAHLILAALVLGAVNVLFYHLLERPTLKGRGVLNHLDGFRKYLGDADDRALHQGDRLARFEQFLPFAIALGLEERWSSAFADVLQPVVTGGRRVSPTPWYTHDHDGFTSGRLASSLGSGLSSSLSSASAAPSSGGSGGGFSSGGGGFSGGGGGGGGGGGW
jgi:hypothetical protein